MKKLHSIFTKLFGVMVISAFITNPASSRGSAISAGPGAIPDNISKIAERSCVKCHSVPGKHMALSMVNLTTWDKLSPEKQAAKANKMCWAVNRSKMPPKKFSRSNPGAAPTKEEITMICDWAKSLQVEKK